MKASPSAFSKHLFDGASVGGVVVGGGGGALPEANQDTVVDQWRPEVRFYHGRRAFGVDAVRVYHS